MDDIAEVLGPSCTSPPRSRRRVNCDAVRRQVASKAYANGNKNPKAHQHARLLPPDKAKAGKESLSPLFVPDPELLFWR
jgi:hypothetical protein